MPITAPDLSKMRDDRQAQLWRLGIFQPLNSWVGQVDGNQTRGATSITVKNAVESIVPETYFTLLVGTAPGLSDIATLYFKSIVGVTMKVGYNDVSWTDGAHITVKQEIRPWAVLPNIENTLEDGDKAYVDENTNLHPLGRIGPPAAGVLPFDGVHETDLTISFWSNSVAMASGAALTSHTWTFENGNPGASAIAGTSGVPIEVVYNTPGNHWVKYVVTDDNGKAHVRYSCVYVFNRANPAIEDFKVTSIRGGLQNGGWTMTVKVFEECDDDIFGDNAQVVLFCDAYWDGIRDDVGYNWEHRDNINFVGYIVKDSVKKNPETSSTTFEIQGIGPLMKTITCWGASLKNTGDAGWHMIPSMTLDSAIFHVFTEHTNIDHICDLNLDLSDLALPVIDIIERSVYEQVVTQIGEAGRAVMASDKQGNIYLEHNKQLVSAADRVGIDSYLTMTHDDWRDALDLNEEWDIRQVNQLDFIGFTSDLVEYGSLAPGRQHWSGAVQKVIGVLVSGQAQANTFAGLFEGVANNDFAAVGIPMRGFWPVFDIVPQRYLAMTLLAEDTNRGLVWTAVKHFVREVSYNFPESNDYVLTDLVVEQDVVGAAGIDNEIPQDEPPLPPPPPPPPPTPPPVVEEEEEPETVMIILTNESGGIILCRTTDFGEVAPTWGLTLDPLSSYGYALHPYLAPFNAETAYTYNANDNFLFIYRIDDYNTALPSKTTITCSGGIPAGFSYTFGGHHGHGLGVSLHDGDKIAWMCDDFLTGRPRFNYSVDKGVTFAQSGAFPSETSFYGNNANGMKGIYPIPGEDGSWHTIQQCGWNGPTYGYRLDGEVINVGTRVQVKANEMLFSAQTFGDVDSAPGILFFLWSGNIYYGTTAVVSLAGPFGTRFCGNAGSTEMAVFMATDQLKVYTGSSWDNRGDVMLMVNPSMVVPMSIRTVDWWAIGRTAPTGETLIKYTNTGGHANGDWSDKTGNLWTILSALGNPWNSDDISVHTITPQLLEA